MSIVPIAHASSSVLGVIPPNSTSCPISLPALGPHGVKRPAEANFFYQGRGDGGKRRPPPDHYTCNRCKVKGHWIQECPQAQPVDASRQTETAARRPPPESYSCNHCHVKGHWIQDCPSRPSREAQPGRTVAFGSGARPPPPISEADCWFCLSSPQVGKHLITSIGAELYLAMSRGQLVNPDLPESSPGH
ncbi:MAG: hypothetical protein BJ554DRAFT_8442, partial [Olpidium bornovanus]